MPSLRLPLAILIIALLTGCGSSRPSAESVAPTVRAASTAADQADQSGASQHAALELRTARQKVQQAQAALDSGDTERALRLAEQAEVDAALAEATARAATAQAAVEEVRETIRVLREEIQRNRTR